MAEVKASPEPSLLVVIEGAVFDLGKFARFHPGGRRPLEEYKGKDATEAFFALHNRQLLEKYRYERAGERGRDGQTTCRRRRCPSRT